jgi:hypothetical protein
VELATKFRKVVPIEDWEDELYVLPSTENMDFIKKEKQGGMNSGQTQH